MPALDDDWQACYRPNITCTFLKLIKMVAPTAKMAGEGMVAVVQGLRDCGVAVALLDEDGKTYTLVPRPVERKSAATAALPSQCDAGAQATDGRYATVYKVHHCKMTPTSPPTHLPEFPPQRAEVCPGHDNFEVGGTGSGETYVPTRSSCYRGGMCWTDRGSVCSPRPSRDPDAFASSLRKYPATPDRSAEMVERLITYSQHNSYNRSPRHYSPPCRSCEHASSHCSARSSRQGAYEPEPFPRRQRSPEEYPTRDRRCYEAELSRKSTFSKNSDIRIVRDISRRVRDSIKSMSSYAVAPHQCTDTRDRYEAPAKETCHPNVVNTEIQAAASMVSRKVSTVPEPVPIKRTIAIPLSPASSDTRPDQTFQLPIDPAITRSVQTIDKRLLGKSVQTSNSFTEIRKKAKVTRKSKSFSDFAIDKELKDDILEWLDDDRDPELKKLQAAVMKKLRSKLKKITAYNSEKLKRNHDCEECQDKRKERLPNDLQGMDVDYLVLKSAEMLETKINGLTMPNCMVAEKNSFDKVIKQWINDISIPKRGLLKPVIKEQVYNTFVKRLKHSADKKSTYYRQQMLKTEILDLLDEIPLDYSGFSKTIYLNTFVDALITKLEDISQENKETMRCNGFLYPSMPQTSTKYLEPIEKEERLLADLIETTQIKIKPDNTREIEVDLADIQIATQAECCNNLSLKEISVLLNNITKLQEQDVGFAAGLTENLNAKKSVVETRPETVFLLQNTSKVNTRFVNKTDEITEVDVKDEDDESNKYMNQLAEQIDQWLSNLKVSQAHDEELRQAVVNDLASDIIDRQKYLELSNNRGSDIDELEHLKYQIFKWINKLVGEDNTETIDHAAELMQRIKNISVPLLSTPVCQEGILDTGVRDLGKSYTSIPAAKLKSGTIKWDDYPKKQMLTERPAQTVFTAATNNQSKTHDSSQLNNNQKAESDGSCSRNNKGSKSGQQASESRSNSLGESSKHKSMSLLKPPCCPVMPPGTPSMKQLNEEFDEYVTNWVKEIPIASSTPEEAAIAEKARLGIHNGIWKAITRMKFEPATFHNKFLYEDVLEEEIDGLLNLLPQTPELEEQRYLLKVRLIEKTTETNDMIWTAASPASYKQQLAQQVASNLPRRVVDTNEEDPNKLFEEMLILCIADDFILATRYKDEDKVKANAYRNKVIRKIGEIIDEVKRTHGKELQDLNSELCINDVVSALYKVPLPTEETIKQEADEILLGLEIEQWFNDLPIVKNDEKTEQLHRRRLKDALAKKLHELEKEVNIADCSGEPQFKHEISVFLEKLPLEKDESLNINFMVDELTNRMKNREKSTSKRKSVAFQDGQPENKALQVRPHELSSQSQPCPGRKDASSQGEFGRQYDMSWSDTMNPGHRYDAFSKDVPACSSMINAPTEPKQPYNDPPHDYRQWGLDSKQSQQWYSFDTMGNVKESRAQPNPANLPGKLHEEHLGGNFGYPLHAPISSQRNAYSDPVDSPNSMRQGPTMGTFFDSQGNLKPSGANQHQPSPAPVFPDHSGQQSYGRGPQNMDSAVGCSMRSQGGAMPQNCPGMSQNPVYDQPMDMSSFRRFSSDRPPSSSWKEASGEFVSLLHDSNGPPQQNYAPQVPHQRPPPLSPQRTFHEPYMHQSEQALGGRFGLNNTPASPCQNCSQRAASPPRPDQFNEQQPANFSNLQGQPSLHTSQGRQNETNFNLADRSVPAPIHGTAMAPDFNKTSSREVPQMIDHNRSANASFQRMEQNRSVCAQPQELQRSMPQATPFLSMNQDRDFAQPQEPQNRDIPQTCPHITINESNRVASPSFYDQDPRFLAPNQPPSDISISNQPVGFSTPNQRTSNAHPPNIKVRRQLEKDKNSIRRVESGTDDDTEEVRVRCQCIERFSRRFKKRRGSFFGCDELMARFPFYFPMGYPYPYFFNGRQ